VFDPELTNFRIRAGKGETISRFIMRKTGTVESSLYPFLLPNQSSSGNVLAQSDHGQLIFRQNRRKKHEGLRGVRRESMTWLFRYQHEPVLSY